MNPAARRGLFWTPRILTLAFALFLSIFALDVFDMGLGVGGTVLALFVHLTPVFAVLLVLAIAWKREWVGAVLLPAFALLYLVWAWERFQWSSLVLSVPLAVVGLLFLVNWMYRTELREDPKR